MAGGEVREVIHWQRSSFVQFRTAKPKWGMSNVQMESYTEVQNKDTFWQNINYGTGKKF